jgi:hypothetical protein
LIVEELHGGIVNCGWGNPLMFHPERLLPAFFRTHLAKDPDVNAIILDEHGPGFAITFSWGRQVQSGSGGRNTKV